MNSTGSHGDSGRENHGLDYLRKKRINQMLYSNKTYGYDGKAAAEEYKSNIAGNRRSAPRFLRMQFTAVVFVLMLVVILLSHKSISYETHERILEPIMYTSLTPSVQWSRECLLIYEDGDEMGKKAVRQWRKYFHR